MQLDQVNGKRVGECRVSKITPAVAKVKHVYYSIALPPKNRIPCQGPARPTKLGPLPSVRGPYQANPSAWYLLHKQSPSFFLSLSSHAEYQRTWCCAIAARRHCSGVVIAIDGRSLMVPNPISKQVGEGGDGGVGTTQLGIYGKQESVRESRPTQRDPGFRWWG